VTTRWAMLSKVPEITVWFWIIKILCITVGESFADWINMTLGVGLNATALIFTAVFGVVLAWQLSLNRYVPFAYWLTVVVVSVTGTLYTDILTDDLHVPLALSTSVFATVLAMVFAVWWARERTLSIHSITTLPRELFYWLAILVTFATGRVFNRRQQTSTRIRVRACRRAVRAAVQRVCRRDTTAHRAATPRRSG
jgi:uncharacterized membrane-anchored protein